MIRNSLWLKHYKINGIVTVENEHMYKSSPGSRNWQVHAEFLHSELLRNRNFMESYPNNVVTFSR